MKASDWQFDRIFMDEEDNEARNRALRAFFSRPLDYVTSREAPVHCFTAGFARGVAWALAKMQPDAPPLCPVASCHHPHPPGIPDHPPLRLPPLAPGEVKSEGWDGQPEALAALLRRRSTSDGVVFDVEIGLQKTPRERFVAHYSAVERGSPLAVAGGVTGERETVEEALLHALHDVRKRIQAHPVRWAPRSTAPPCRACANDAHGGCGGPEGGCGCAADGHGAPATLKF